MVFDDQLYKFRGVDTKQRITKQRLLHNSDFYKQRLLQNDDCYKKKYFNIFNKNIMLLFISLIYKFKQKNNKSIIHRFYEQFINSKTKKS